MFNLVFGNLKNIFIFKVYQQHKKADTSLLSVCRQSTKKLDFQTDCKRLSFEARSLVRSGVTLNGNEHRRQAKQRRKRAFVNSLKADTSLLFH
ncbi:hypothetical protein CON00_10325 [Bacillus sp. AFS096315]|nr:hypothetical protein CON00_10325 [Bacillus sp. AFS096315]